ncbi:MAG: hypothetical protein O2890_08005 [Cyanobacteria bacterium]|nr:hypothetical protein [Cyanobacteriota bacterium]MDA0866350.1 hypothetical protein [Cyanobacteriota bacterium]
MKRQVIETFLNLSAIVGMTLMDDGRSRPYFYGIDSLLNAQQLEALTLSALNSRRDATAHYLGKIAVANTWRSARPAADCLTSLTLDRNGHLALEDTAAPPTPHIPVDDDTQAVLPLWVEGFSTRCARMIRDYRKMVLTPGSNAAQRAALQIS